jgi:hypothetical protein
VSFVELYADLDTRLARNRTEHRHLRLDNTEPSAEETAALVLAWLDA